MSRIRYGPSIAKDDDSVIMSGFAAQAKNKGGKRQKRGGEEEDSFSGFGAQDDAADEVIGIPYAKSRAKFVNPDRECFGCIACLGTGEGRGPTVIGHHPKIDAIMRAFEENFDSMSMESLAKLLHAAYQKHVYDPELLAGFNPLWWPESLVLEHLQHHITNLKMLARQKISKLNVYEAELEASGNLQETPGGQSTVNVVHMKMFLELGKQKLEYIKHLSAEARGK